MSGEPIVVGTDGSSTAALAVDKAGELAQALGTSVHVVCVPAAIPAYDWPARITGQRIVAEAGERLRGRGIAVETHLPKDQGDAALALVDVADSQNAQMIVVGNKGMTGIRRFFGSFPNRVSHGSRRSVLIIPTQSGSVAEFRGGSVVVGTDGSSDAAPLVKEAIRLAKALDGDLHVVSATEPSESELATAAAEGVRLNNHTLQGDQADALLSVAEDHGPAILVVGSKGMRTGEREWLGNIADKISHKGTASVLIVATGDVSAGNDDVMSGVTAEETG